MSPTKMKTKTPKTDKGRKIYVGKGMWFYGNDPFDKEKVEATRKLFKDCDFSAVLAERGKQRQEDPSDANAI